MNDGNLPQCLSTVRFQEMLLDGTIGEQEVRALETDRRLGWPYRRLRSCDEKFQAMLTMRGARRAANGAPDADAPPQKPPQLLYAEYLRCASGALCEKSLVEWGTCMKLVQTVKKDIRECAQKKKLLERCLRGKTEDLLKASQPQVFRPSATS